MYVLRPRTRGRRWLWRRRLWPPLLRWSPSFPFRRFWLPPSQPQPVSPSRQPQPPSVSPGWSVKAPPPPRRLWPWQRSPPLPSQYHRRHSWTANSRESEAIWNVKTRSEVLTIFPDYSLKLFYFQTTSLKYFLSYCRSEMFFFRLRVWNESEAIWSNLTQSEIWRRNLKFFVPIWYQSDTILKPVWKIHQSEVFSYWYSEVIWNILETF